MTTTCPTPPYLYIAPCGAGFTSQEEMDAHIQKCGAAQFFLKKGSR